MDGAWGRCFYADSGEAVCGVAAFEGRISDSPKGQNENTNFWAVFGLVNERSILWQSLFTINAPYAGAAKTNGWAAPIRARPYPVCRQMPGLQNVCNAGRFTQTRCPYGLMRIFPLCTATLILRTSVLRTIEIST
ncbi:hypothetical protein SDC9_138303 [bioreactor metagenome]|uniref:Uncharacterized protein n=1 Tax=bioreactor metagenome TaxID=1076179 RepID=A0A645DPE8_9ZZZZ